jgi:V/A-type H+-transporting ATPase subunit D
MARIKHTKTELKRQRDALRRFERFLPTLQLKQQQLKIEMRHIEAQIEENEAARQKFGAELARWVSLFAEPFDFAAHLRVAEVRQAEGNIAGVTIPVLQEVVFERTLPDLLRTPPWVDDGLLALERMIRFRIERRILDEQRHRLAEELRVTNQRVNLFEKVKIPESRGNIRTIRIFLGDLGTAEVARAKLAKRKTVERVQVA